MRISCVLTSCVLVLAACASDVAPPAATPRETAHLLDTYWKLTRLGDRVVESPAGTRELHLVLHSENARVSGFSGCNRMMGSYLLENASLRFEQMGGTLMACVADMQLEKSFLAMFAQVARWEITGETLRLLDANGASVATFVARQP